MFSLTSITSVSAAPNVRKESVKITMTSVNGKEINVSTAKEAIVNTFEELFGGSIEIVSSFLKDKK